MKVIICVFIKSRFPVARHGDFHWSNDHKCHIWQGREFSIEEINSGAADPIFNDDNHFYRPTVRLVPGVAAKPARERQLLPA